MAGVRAETSSRASRVHDAAVAGHFITLEGLVTDDPSLISAQDVEGRTPISCAAEAGYLSCVMTLLNADPKSCRTTDSHGNTPIFYAAKTGHADVFCLLLRYGRELLTYQNKQGESALSVLSLIPVRTQQLRRFEELAGVGAVFTKMRQRAGQEARAIYFSRSLTEFLFYAVETYPHSSHACQRQT